MFTIRTASGLTHSNVTRRVQTLGLAVLLACGGATMTLAQGFQWPWEQQPARPREPVNRPPAGIPAPIPSAPQAAPNPQAPVPQGVAPQAQQAPSWGARNPICVQLEQRLVTEKQKGAQSTEALPRLETEMRQLERTTQTGNAQLEKADCFEYFLFSKTLRGTKQCRDMAGQIDAAKRRLGELETQRQQIIGGSSRSYADDITRELARNNCGGQYQRDASRPPGGLFGDDSEGAASGGGYSGSQYATYRTVCVRLCDGYYFPISFSTLPNHFTQDSDACQSKCAAPVELYYHPNPGGAMEQATSAKSQEPYTRLKTAFRYRKEYVQGCSCKEAEYVPPAGTVSVPFPTVPATPPAAAPTAADRRAETRPAAPAAAPAQPR
jgi:hypothetical protein